MNTFTLGTRVLVAHGVSALPGIVTRSQPGYVIVSYGNHREMVDLSKHRVTAAA